jgi:hypothetical protein
MQLTSAAEMFPRTSSKNREPLAHLPKALNDEISFIKLSHKRVGHEGNTDDARTTGSFLFPFVDILEE